MFGSAVMLVTQSPTANTLWRAVAISCPLPLVLGSRMGCTQCPGQEDGLCWDKYEADQHCP